MENLQDMFEMPCKFVGGVKKTPRNPSCILLHGSCGRTVYDGMQMFVSKLPAVSPASKILEYKFNGIV